MIIADNILKNKLKNVYFIWGSGKTTAADILSEKYGIYVYHTDHERSKFFGIAEKEFQPSMCRVVPDFWALPKDEALAWEAEIVREFTPMVIADLIELSAVHEKIICEGDLDFAALSGIVTNAVFISYHGKDYDFFDRPEQRKMLDDIRKRDISDAEKEELIANAYSIVNGKENKAPDWVKQILRDDHSAPEGTAAEIANYFGFGSNC